MKKLNFVFLTLIILSFGSDIYCQNGFGEGYVIKKSGESMNGLVKYSARQNDPSECVFKRFDIAREVVYSPKEIEAFGYRNWKRYESKDLNGKISFFEVIISGKITLYAKGSKFFIDKDKIGLIELSDGPVRYKTGGEVKEYGTLADFLRYITEGKAEPIPDNFNPKDDIEPLITAYNKNVGNNYNVFNRSVASAPVSAKAVKAGVSRGKFSFVAGVSSYNLNLAPADLSILREPMEYVYPADIKNSGGYSVGLQYEKGLSRKSDRLSVICELLFTSQSLYSYNKENSEEMASDHFIIKEFQADMKGLKVPVILQYSFKGAKVKPFINAGIAYRAMLDKSYLYYKEIDRSVVINIYDIGDEIAFRNGEFSLLGGAGMEARLFNKFNVQIQGRVEIGSGLLDNSLIRAYDWESDMVSLKPFTQYSLQSGIFISVAF
jgi:hypothetical protein